MKVKSIGSNQIEVRTKNATILVSYETPVAAWVDGDAYKTDTFHSITTSKHINQWFDGGKPELKPQSFFNELMEV